MTERSIKNIANVLMVAGLFIVLYSAGKSLVLAIIAGTMMVAGMLTQMFFELKRFIIKP